MPQIEIAVSLKRYIDMKELLRSIPDLIIAELEKKGEDILYHDSKGSSITITIDAQAGEDWGAKEIKVVFTYSSIPAQD